MIFNRLFEQRAVSFQSIFASGDNIEYGSMAGTPMNSDTAFSVNAIYAAISLISDTISTLPLDAYVDENGSSLPYRPRPSWIDQPDIDIPRAAFYSQVITSLLLDGSSFIRVYQNPRGEVVNLVVLNPLTVEIKRNGLGRLLYEVQGEDQPLNSEQVIYIPDVLRPGTIRGVSRVKELKNNFGLALALENWASQYFGNGVSTSGVIEFPGNLTQAQADDLRGSFETRHGGGWRRNGRTGILSGGATFKNTLIDPQTSTLIESRRMAVEDICRAFTIPPNLMGLPGTSSYASVEQNNLAWVTHGLRPIVTKIEAALSPLLSKYQGGKTAFLRFNLNGLLRADITARMSAYSTGLQSGFLTINDVRSLEDLRPIADSAADTVRVPLANVNIDQSGLSAERQKVQMAQMLVVSGYDPADVLRVVGIDPIAHSGLPSSQLQPVAQIDPTDPSAVYSDEVK
jgi:HK97 family phage portal protein